MEIEWDIYGDILSDKKNNCYQKPPAKSIVDAWYEKIGYRFLGGGLTLYSVLFKSNTK
jgi:hypothetical protein